MKLPYESCIWTQPRVYGISFIRKLWSVIESCCNIALSFQTSWWRHQMETFSALLALCAGNSPVAGERPVTRSFDVFFDLRLNKQLSKQSWGWWFETPSHPLWRHSNVLLRYWIFPTDAITVLFYSLWHGPLAGYVQLGLCMRRECRECFPRHRGLAIPTCITARSCRDACRNR